MRSVRVMVLASFLTLITAAAGIVWIVADAYNRKNTEQLAAQIQRQLAHRIDVRVRELLSTPHRLNAIGGRVIQGAQLDLSEPEAANAVFYNVLQAYPHINAVFFGGSDGVMYGARWSRDKSYCEVMLASPETNGALNYYRMDDFGRADTPVESAPGYDPRARAWYTDAVAAGGPTWSPIYLDFSTRALVMTAAEPIHDERGTLLGVLGCGIQFEQIDNFLRSLDVGTSGLAYLMEPDGTLVSASAPGHTYRVDGENPTRLQAHDSTNEMIRASARQLGTPTGIRAHLNLMETVTIHLDSGPAFASTFRINDPFGLAWLGVIVVPQADYTAVVHDRNRTAFIVFLLVTLCALLAGLVVARFFTRPLTQLADAADSIARESWDIPLDTGRMDEFGALANAFDAMRRQLHNRIEELQSTRNALRESEERYARAQEAARVVTWDWELDSNTIRWREQNDPIVATSPGEHELDLHTYLDRVHPEDREYASAHAEAAISGTGDYDMEYRLERDDGVLRWVAVKGDVLRDDNGTATGLTGVLLDISDRKRLEAQLRESQKMDAVGRLAGGIAHDFNNLLQAIQGFAEMGRQDVPPDSPAFQDFEEIIQAGERAARLVSQLLAFSRRQLLSMGNIALEDVVADMGSMLSRLIDETIILDVEGGDSGAIIRADRGQIEQVIINLCINARDAMPDGGCLRITVARETLAPADCAHTDNLTPGEYVVLRVHDTGTGMDKVTMGLIFDPFFTTKEVGKGTGLGLATVYGIVEQHGGHIQVESTPGAGTTFSVYFPVVSARKDTTDADVPLSEMPGGHETILVAEDDSAVRQLARRILERAGYTVLEAVDGMTAIARFEEHREQIDAAFLDVVMPGKGGRAVWDHLHARSPSLPVLFATGYAEGGVHTNFVLEEGLRLILKPYTPHALLEAVYDLLHRRENPPDTK